jgi:sirohydrochlorin cobaltochelatase
MLYALRGKRMYSRLRYVKAHPLPSGAHEKECAMKIKHVVVLAIAGVLLASCVTTKEISMQGTKPVIVIAAFGSSYESGQKNLEDFDTAVRAAFPDTEVRWAFTAQFIVNKLREEGRTTIFERKVPVKNLEEVYEDLRAEEKRTALVSCLQMMVGAEFRQVLNTPTTGLQVKYVYPILFYPENIQNIVIALESEFGDPKDTATIFCAHGNEKHPENNAELVQVDNFLRSNYKNTYLAVMEGNPEFYKVREEVTASGVEKVRFVTFMLTSGDHMTNDVMGDEEDSMKSQLGLQATATGGLASNRAVQEMFIAQMKSVYAQF